MKVFSTTNYGPVTCIEVGALPFGRPLMTTRFYLVDTILFDTGLKHCQPEILAWLSDQTISSIHLTHHHEDHSGNAAAIKHIHNIPVYGHQITVEKLTKPLPILPYQRLVWGPTTPLDVLVNDQLIESEHYKFLPVHTPGHSRDHTVYLEPDQGWLLSGDLFLAERIKYFRSDEILEDQIGSLEKVLTFEFDMVLCAHNPKYKNGKQHLFNKLDFLKSLVEQVEVYWSKGLNARQIMKAIGMKEELLIRLMCAGNVKAEHMITSAIRLLEKRAA